MQWYAFHKEPPGGVDGPNGKKERLLKLFGGWCENVIDLLVATDEDAILRRDIYDRTPSFSWGKDRVTLLGDSIHAMQPNLGQGGCMAIEDSYQLALELDKAWRQSIQSGSPIDVVSSLRSYENARRVRVAVIHGLARMAAFMATTYKPYLGVGLGPLSFLTKFRIPHPGRVGGRIFIDMGMPLMLSWVLGGYGDLSNNVGLRGSLPPSIGNLQNLTILVLVGCSFSGPIPDSIGSLPNLIFLSLNSNGFSGPIPPSIGNLSKLSWLDLSENQLNGTIPISSGTTPGLDMLLNARHFHLSKNQISGSIPLQLFSPNMNLIHVFCEDFGSYTPGLEFPEWICPFKNLPLLMSKKPEKEILSAV